MEFNMPMFYRLGILCFSIVALMQLLNLIWTYSSLTIFSIIQGAAQFAFTCLLIWFFAYMYKGTKAQFKPSTESAKDLQDELKELIDND